MERKDAIRDAYFLAGSSSSYNGMMACSTISGRAVCHASGAWQKSE